MYLIMLKSTKYPKDFFYLYTWKSMTDKEHQERFAIAEIKDIHYLNQALEKHSYTLEEAQRIMKKYNRYKKSISSFKDFNSKAPYLIKTSKWIKINKEALKNIKKKLKK